MKTKIKMKRAASRAAQSPKLHQSFGDCAASLILGQQADQYRVTILRAHVYSGVFFGKPPGKPGAGLPIGSRTQVKSFLCGGGGVERSAGKFRGSLTFSSDIFLYNRLLDGFFSLHIAGTRESLIDQSQEPSRQDKLYCPDVKLRWLLIVSRSHARWGRKLK